MICVFTNLIIYVPDESFIEEGKRWKGTFGYRKQRSYENCEANIMRLNKKG